MRVAIVSNGNAFSTVMLRPLFDAPDVEVAGAVLVRVPPGPGGPIATLWRLSRRTGVRYAAHKFGSLAVPRAIALASRRPVFLDGMCRARATPVERLRTANGPAALAFLRGLEPEVLVSVSSPERFEPEVLEVPSVAAINLHWGLLPAYAGIAPYFWVLRNGESETGLTVHVMAPELDVGPVLRQRRIEIRPRDTSLALQLRLAMLGAEELLAAVRDLPASLRSAAAQDRSGRSYFTWPARADVRALRARGRRLARWRDYRELRRVVDRRN